MQIVRCTRLSLLNELGKTTHVNGVTKHQQTKKKRTIKKKIKFQQTF